MFIVVSEDGAVLANMTSGVDAHCIQKATPGSRTYHCNPNSRAAVLMTGQQAVRSERAIVCRFATVNQSSDQNDDHAGDCEHAGGAGLRFV